MNVFTRGSQRTDGQSGLLPAPTAFVSLYGQAGSSNYATLQLTGTTVGYQVPSGKTLVITRVMAGVGGSPANSAAIHLIYGDTDVGLNSGSAPTTPVRLVGDGSSSTQNSPMSWITTNGADVNVPDFSIFVTVPQNKYPAIRIAGVSANAAYLEGYLY